jgi:hypothetical protein
MLRPADLPNPIPITFELRELIARLKAGVFLVGWYDPVRGLQVMPIGDRRAVRPDTMVYQVPGEDEVAVLMAAKMLLDEGNENGAYACLVEIAEEHRAKH